MKLIRIVQAAKAPGRTMMLGTEDDMPILIRAAIRPSTSAPARGKCALIVPINVDEDGYGDYGLLDEFRLELN